MSGDTHIDAVVRDTVALVLGRVLRPGEDLRREQEPAWDSLKHVELLFALEGALDLQFDEEEFATLDSVALLVESAKRHRE